ncbi:Chloroperoxidase [Mycena amicta]|nr:Chloroperoxidase [Mycena amicta]
MTKFLFNIYIFTWDAWLTLINLLTPKRKLGSVVRPGASGAGGEWPEYVAPKEGDSRSCCPALNAMANHGILPHDGRNISFRDMGDKIHATFNFAPTFCRFVPQYAADMLHKDFHKDTLDLADLNLHNGIEHDASLTREDQKFDPDQDKPYLPFINELLDSASGKDSTDTNILTLSDLQRYSAKRRVDARARNPDFSLAKTHKVFGSANSSTLITIFGGRVDDLSSFLREERIPQGWEPRVRQRMGLTFITFNRTLFKLEKGIDKYEAEFVPAPVVEDVEQGANTRSTDGLV